QGPQGEPGSAGDFTAGDGIDIASDVISADVSDFAGAGLEDDGSNNLRISSAAAGAGLSGGGGSALAVGAGTGIDVAANSISVDVTDIIDGTTITETGGGDIQRAAITGDVAIGLASNTSAIQSGVIVNAHVSSSAAISQTKTGALSGEVT